MSAPEAYNVTVVGGGTAGFSAAVAAGRMEGDVALVEIQDLLGGAGTTNLVVDFFNAYWDGERYIIGGIFEEVRQRLIGRKALYQTRGPHNRGKIGQEVYNPDEYADEIEIMCREAGVDLYMENRVVSAEYADGKPTVVELADGTTFETNTLVDATGDAVVADNAGVSTTFGSEDENWVQPATHMYTVGPVDMKTIREEFPESVMYDENLGEYWASLGPNERIHGMIEADLEAGELDIPVTQLTALMNIPGNREEMTVNFGHVDVADPTDEDELAEATEEGRRQMREGVRWIRENLPGFEDIEVAREADKIGVRESRQIEGLYELTKEDVLSTRQFDDVIAQSCSPIDIHKAGKDRGWALVPRGENYDIPLRSLIPRDGPENLVVAGRCISMDHYAMASVRQQASVIAIGEAAGVTAAMAAEQDVAIEDVEADQVQDRLCETGAILS